MENRTYFFRGESYTIYEMLQRIDKVNIIEMVKNQLGVETNSKQEAIRLIIDNIEDEDYRYSVVKSLFDSCGKKGDVLNIHLYSLNRIDLDILKEEKIQYLLSLKGKGINSLPLIGAFCKTTCYLNDIKVNNNVIDFKFIFEIGSVGEENGQPKYMTDDVIIECRHYVEKGLIAIVDNRKTEQTSVISIIQTLPYFLKLQLSEENGFVYAEPDFTEVFLNPSQLECLKLLLNGKLRSTELQIDGEKDVSIKISSTVREFENISNFLKQTKPKGKTKALEFFYYDDLGKKQIISIRNNGQITSSNYIDENTYEGIINLVYKIIEVNDFLVQVDTILEKYCDFIRKGMITRAREKIKSLILDELYDLIKEIIEINNLNFIPSSVYLTVVLNIIIKLLQTDCSSSTEYKLDINKYMNLVNFLNIYIEKKYSIKLSNESICKATSILNDIIINAGQDENKMIKNYKNNF